MAFNRKHTPIYPRIDEGYVAPEGFFMVIEDYCTYPLMVEYLNDGGSRPRYYHKIDEKWEVRTEVSRKDSNPLVREPLITDEFLNKVYQYLADQLAEKAIFDE
jgi:hypothetical protein